MAKKRIELRSKNLQHYFQLLSRLFFGSRFISKLPISSASGVEQFIQLRSYDQSSVIYTNFSHASHRLHDYLFVVWLVYWHGLSVLFVFGHSFYTYPSIVTSKLTFNHPNWESVLTRLLQNCRIRGIPNRKKSRAIFIFKSNAPAISDYSLSNFLSNAIGLDASREWIWSR